MSYPPSFTQTVAELKEEMETIARSPASTQVDVEEVIGYLDTIDPNAVASEETVDPEHWALIGEIYAALPQTVRGLKKEIESIASALASRPAKVEDVIDHLDTINPEAVASEETVGPKQWALIGEIYTGYLRAMTGNDLSRNWVVSDPRAHTVGRDASRSQNHGESGTQPERSGIKKVYDHLRRSFRSLSTEAKET